MEADKLSCNATAAPGHDPVGGDAGSFGRRDLLQRIASFATQRTRPTLLGFSTPAGSTWMVEVPRRGSRRIGHRRAPNTDFSGNVTTHVARRPEFRSQDQDAPRRDLRTRWCGKTPASLCLARWAGAPVAGGVGRARRWSGRKYERTRRIESVTRYLNDRAKRRPFVRRERRRCSDVSVRSVGSTPSADASTEPDGGCAERGEVAVGARFADESRIGRCSRAAGGG